MKIKKRKMGDKPRRALVAQLDKVFSEYIRKRDGKCVQCGTTEGLTCGHLITRGKYSTRWSELNCFCQCRGCNMKHEYQPEHFTSFFINRYGSESYQWLVRYSMEIKKYTNDDLMKLIEYYETLLKDKEFKEVTTDEMTSMMLQNVF